MLIRSEFRPAWWLPGAHSQTLWANLLRPVLPITTEHRRLELPDGDFLDLRFAGSPDGPISLIMPGLGGSLNSRYAVGMMKKLVRQGFFCVFICYRNCSGEPNRLPSSFHAGETGDLGFVIERLKHWYPGRPIVAIGYSLGANMLLKYLGERGDHSSLEAAVAVSVPFDLAQTVYCLTHGFSRIYQVNLLIGLKKKFLRKSALISIPGVSRQEVISTRTLREFDEVATSRLHGFQNAEHYYRSASCRPYMRDIVVPTLVLQARDDPFSLPESLPKDSELSPHVSIEASEYGGHVGFVSGSSPLRPRYWLEERIAGYFIDDMHIGGSTSGSRRRSSCRVTD